MSNTKSVARSCRRHFPLLIVLLTIVAAGASASPQTIDPFALKRPGWNSLLEQQDEIDSVIDRESQLLYPARYAREWAKAGIKGEVILIVWLNQDATVDRIEIERSSGYRELDESAEAAARQWRYRKILVDGKALDALRVPFDFRP